MPYDYTTSPFRLRLQKRICAVIEGITPANGYQTDLSPFTDDAGREQKRVFRGRDLFGENDPIPMVSVLEDPRPLEPNQDLQASQNEYRLAIQGFVEDDEENPTDPAHYLAAEIIKVLAEQKEDRYNILGFGPRSPCVVKMTIGQPIHRPADNEISDVAYCFVPLSLILVENLEQSFA